MTTMTKTITFEVENNYTVLSTDDGRISIRNLREGDFFRRHRGQRTNIYQLGVLKTGVTSKKVATNLRTGAVFEISPYDGNMVYKVQDVRVVANRPSGALHVLNNKEVTCEGIRYKMWRV